MTEQMVQTIPPNSENVSVWVDGVLLAQWQYLVTNDGTVILAEPPHMQALISIRGSQGKLLWQAGVL